MNDIIPAGGKRLQTVIETNFIEKGLSWAQPLRFFIPPLCERRVESAVNRGCFCVALGGIPELENIPESATQSRRDLMQYDEGGKRKKVRQMMLRQGDAEGGSI